jgi:hypothetical protein
MRFKEPRGESFTDWNSKREKGLFKFFSPTGPWGKAGNIYATVPKERIQQLFKYHPSQWPKKGANRRFRYDPRARPLRAKPQPSVAPNGDWNQ